MTLEAKIEAILFFKSEPVSAEWLCKTLGISAEELQGAFTNLKENLVGRGIRLVENDSGVMLMTAPEASELIETITKEELTRDIGKAGLETLTIILYKAPVSKNVIDYIRGVNSGFILRNLLIRGLVERKPNPTDKRTFIYSPALKLLAHLGISTVEELPEYEEMTAKIEAFEKDFNDKEEKESSVTDQTEDKPEEKRSGEGASSPNSFDE